MADTIARDSGTEGLLTAEEAGRTILASLEALRAETEGYVAAERTLRDSGERIVQLAARLEELSQRSADALEIVRSSGAPQIVEELRGISPVLQAQGESQAKQVELMRGLEEKASSTNSQLAELRQEQVDKSEKTLAVISGMRSRIQLMVGGLAGLTLVVFVLVLVLLLK